MFSLISRLIRHGSGELARRPKFHANEAGATAAEYSLLVALIAAVIIATVSLISPELLPGFQAIILQL